MPAVTRSRALLVAIPVFSVWGWGCGPPAEVPKPVDPAETSAAAAEPQDDSTPFFGPREITVLEELAPLMTNVFGREVLSLEGDWTYIVDQLQIGDASPLLRGGVGEDEVAKSGELLEYAFDPARTLRVPGDWNSQDPGLFWYRGVVWYRTEFDYQLPEAKRAYLYFGGGNFAKDVYLNGKLIARHRGGFTPFNSEVTEYLEPGLNRLVVKVNSLSEPTDVPTEYNDWLNYGGLTREVLLVEVPRTFVREYSVQLSPERDAIEGWVQLDGPDAGQGATLRIEELGIEEALDTGDDGRATFRVPARPGLWAPGSPTRYAVSIESGEDRVGEPIGFRSIETRGEDILLNGEPVVLRGISTHEESVLHPGRAYGPEDAAAIIGLVEELNGNFLRLAHYPHNEHMVRAADEAGVLLWVEMPVYHNIRFSNEDTLAQAKRQYSEMITRDRNRAAVILWSLANETPGTPARNRFLDALATHVRAEDDTRLITAALIGFDGMQEVGKYIGTELAAEKSVIADLLTSDPDPVTIVIDDPLGETVDVIGYNEYLGWYMAPFIAEGLRDNGLEVDEAEVRERILASLPLFRIATKFGKPLIISEFGAGARQGRRGGPVAIWSEDYQARVYVRQLEFLEKSESIRGISPWILKDFRAPYRLNVPVQDYWNRKGLVSETGEKKLAFGVLSDHYADRAAR
jgi:beta-glucuronidase